MTNNPILELRILLQTNTRDLSLELLLFIWHVYFLPENLLHAYGSQAVVISVTRCPWEPNIRVCLLIEEILSSRNLAQTISAQGTVLAASIRAVAFSRRVKKPDCVHSEVTPFPERTEVCIFHCPRDSFNYQANALQYFLWFKALLYEAMSCTCMKLRCHNISQSSKYSAADNRYSETPWLGQNFSLCLQKCLCE